MNKFGKIFEEEQKPTKDIAASAGASSTGIYKSYAFNPDPNAKEEAPVDEYIRKFLELQSRKLMKYLDSEDKGTKFYAHAKMAELEEHLIKTKMEIYNKSGIAKEVKDNIMKRLAADQKATQQKLDKFIKDCEKEVGRVDVAVAGELYKYKNKAGKEFVVMVLPPKDDGETRLVRVSEEDGIDKPLGEDIIDKKMKEDVFGPSSKLIPLEDDKKEAYKTIVDKYNQPKKEEQKPVQNQPIKEGDKNNVRRAQGQE